MVGVVSVWLEQLVCGWSSWCVVGAVNVWLE